MSRVRFACTGMAAVLLLGALLLPRLVEAVGGAPHLANESAQRNSRACGIVYLRGVFGLPSC